MNQLSVLSNSRLTVSSLLSNHRKQLVRMCLIALIASGIMLAPRNHSAQSCDLAADCAVPAKVDIAFMLDRSGSLASRGQTWNIMVEGVLTALGDATVIPRDGTIAVCVVAFDGAASLVVPLTDINSADDASTVVSQVAALNCGSIGSQSFPCPAGQTSWVAGILSAGNNINKVRSIRPKPGAQRILYLVSDGSTSASDLDQAAQLAEQTRNAAAISGIPLVFNAFLVGVDPASAEFAGNKAALEQIVTPQSPTGSAGATTVITPGLCNLDGATFTSADCSRQSDEFAEKTRSALRPNIQNISLTITIDGDTPPGLFPSGTAVSLRQAIEVANCNGGSATIAFNTSLRGKTIRPLAPLPALTAPDIVINGCDPADQQGCSPLVTIDGGGALADGISIRSNRDVIRGVKITNFTRAGVVVAPACPSDNLGRNLIERNVLENNPTGVLVFDQKSGPRDGFNERNTISRNNISRAAPAADAPPTALIDLGGDGPTANDSDDGDSGPNTLLNFPDSLNVVSTGNNTAMITGQISGPAVAGSTIELYAITASHIVSGKIVIDGVTFLAQTTAGSCTAAGLSASCVFTATGVPVSPTGNYTATVTDPSGNTSELMFRPDGKPAAGPDASFSPTVDFGSVVLNSIAPQRNFAIVNNGSAPLQIAGCSVARCAAADRDDTARFIIGGCPSPTAQINPGETLTLTVTFATTICGAAKGCLTLVSNDLLHAPITSTLTGVVGSSLTPVVTLEANATSLIFGPVSPKGQRRSTSKLIKKATFHTFTIDNKGCNTFSLTFTSIKRVTDVAKCKISDPGANDSGLFLLTQLKSGVESLVFSQVEQFMEIGPGESLTFRVRFNPAVPPVVNKTCSAGNLTADEVLPDEVNSVINIMSTGAGVSSALSVPLTGRITKDVRLIDPTDPSQPPLVTLCRTGNDFIAQFSVYDSNQNVDRATFQFIDNRGRTVQIVDVAGLDQAVAGRSLATGQSFTFVQRFTGAVDNKKVATVQVTVFEKDGSSSSATSGTITTNCAGASSQSLEGVQSARVMLPGRAFDGQIRKPRTRPDRRSG